MIVSDSLNEQIAELSKLTHKSEETVLEEALIIYEDYLKLLNEFDEWDNVSDVDFSSFEGKLNGYSISGNTKE